MLSGWFKLLSTSTASWKSLEDLWALHRMWSSGEILPYSSIQSLVGSLKKHTLWQAHQQLHARNKMIGHWLSGVWTRQEENIARLKSVIRSSINPMKYEDEDLTNIITKVAMPAEVQKDVCNQDDIGQLEYAKFVEEKK